MSEARGEAEPEGRVFDLIVVALGYERRCRWVVETQEVDAPRKTAISFGFLQVASYEDNRRFFEQRGFEIVDLPALKGGLGLPAEGDPNAEGSVFRILVDISSMSREMIAIVIEQINQLRKIRVVELVCAYAPSDASNEYRQAPIQFSRPITPALAGWSSQPDQPLGTIFGLGCEPYLALGALQVLEPNKAWTFTPEGFDPRFAEALRKANQHLSDIFDVTNFQYNIDQPDIIQGKIEALLNAVESSFRMIIVPGGPKILAWLSISIVTFQGRNSVGIWSFSSKDKAEPVDRAAAGPIIWHTQTLSPAGSPDIVDIAR